MNTERVNDVLELRGLRLVMFCGILPEERERAQPLELDVDIVTDTSAAGRSDSIGDTIDYGAVCTTLTALADERFDLLEAVAERAAAAILANPAARRVTVAVRKLRPPVPYDLASAGVRINRSA